MLEISGIAKSYAGRQIVASASLVAARGEVVCLTGPSGAGKTTMLEIMAGVVSPDKGTVRHITPPALMFQDDALIPWLPAEANIAYIQPPRLSSSAVAGIAARWLGRFGLERHVLPAAMSGGMRRRLSLARTLASGRELLLLDEPFAFLDDAWQKIIAEELALRAAAGSGIIIATHAVAPLCRISALQERIRHIAVAGAPLVIEAT
ncbi:MAG: ATP-binding cassette domain-containing protein [Deltaproteobacteria bacterium]|nr:ATP-binding cassette domain-containing protein [Deltaproteobacteria bacterium]